MQIYESLKESIIETPSLITELDDPILLKIIDNLIPYDIGIEIECGRQNHYDIEKFKSISHIIEVRSSNGEERFRIPSGINSILCLKNISDILKEQCELNSGSGIHFHIDMTECYHLLTRKIINDNKEWMLKELDTWKYSGTYNRRDCKFKNESCFIWVAFQNRFKTAEIRIGEMTFEYNLLMKRIIHCCEIIKKLKFTMISEVNSLNLNLQKVQEDEQLSEENPQEIISKRTIKRY